MIITTSQLLLPENPGLSLHQLNQQPDHEVQVRRQQPKSLYDHLRRGNRLPGKMISHRHRRAGTPLQALVPVLPMTVMVPVLPMTVTGEQQGRKQHLGLPTPRLLRATGPLGRQR